MTALKEPELKTQPVELGPLTNAIGFLVRLSQVEVFKTFFREVGHLDLKPGEFSILWVISMNPDVRQGQIAKRLTIKPAHMTKVIQRLETKGFISRQIPDHDRRSVILRLTRQGEAFVAKHHDTYFSYFKGQSNLDATEMKQLVQLLQKFNGLDGE